MNDSTNLDRIRALAQEDLSPAEQARLRARLQHDQELAALSREYQVVHRLTAPLLDEPPACQTTFAVLERALEAAPRTRLWPRRVAAAAAVALLGGVAWIAGPRAAPAGPLTLAAIDLRAAPLPTAASEPPAGLADYDPRGPDGVAWLEDFDTASWLAEASGRPLLVFGGLPNCSMCKSLDEQVFTARSVVDLAERYVPVRFDLDALPEAEAQALMARGYPFLEVWSADREPLLPLSRRPEAEFFVESMRRGLVAADAEGVVASWDDLRSLARTFERGRSDEDQGRLAGAQDSYSTLAAGESEVYRQLGTSGLARISADARSALLRAAEAAEASPDAAADLLRRAVERYAGTEYAADLRAVLERLETSGRFPRLRS